MRPVWHVFTSITRAAAGVPTLLPFEVHCRGGCILELGGRFGYAFDGGDCIPNPAVGGITAGGPATLGPVPQGLYAGSKLSPMIATERLAGYSSGCGAGCGGALPSGFPDDDMALFGSCLFFLLLSDSIVFLLLAHAST